MLSRSSLLSKIEIGNTRRRGQPGTKEGAHFVVHCSPFCVDHHVVTGVFSTFLGGGNLIVAELLDRSRLVNVCAVRSGAEDGSNESWAVLV